MKKITSFIIALTFANIGFTQLIPINEVTLLRAQVWKPVGDEVFGKLLEEVEATTKVTVDTIGIYTLLVIESTLMGGESVMSIKSVKEIPSDKPEDGAYYWLNCSQEKTTNMEFIIHYDKRLSIISVGYLIDGGETVLLFL